jgi:hypothetical protein
MRQTVSMARHSSRTPSPSNFLLLIGSSDVLRPKVQDPGFLQHAFFDRKKPVHFCASQISITY